MSFWFTSHRAAPGTRERAPARRGCVMRWAAVPFKHFDLPRQIRRRPEDKGAAHLVFAHKIQSGKLEEIRARRFIGDMVGLAMTAMR